VTAYRHASWDRPRLAAPLSHHGLGPPDGKRAATRSPAPAGRGRPAPTTRGSCAPAWLPLPPAPGTSAWRLGQPTAGTVYEVAAPKRRKAPVRTPRAHGRQLRARRRPSIPQNRHGPFRPPLPQCGNGDIHGHVAWRRFGRQVHHRCSDDLVGIVPPPLGIGLT
jgi:hypothetical protein